MAGLGAGELMEYTRRYVYCIDAIATHPPRINHDPAKNLEKKRELLTCQGKHARNRQGGYNRGKHVAAAAVAVHGAL